jgi:hypothetical protein
MTLAVLLERATRSMSKRRFIAGLGFPILLVLAAMPVTTRAAPAPGTVEAASLTAERERLRGELDRVGAEIDALKQTGRGVGDDYRLRARLADAEALARRLIEIEARLGLRAPARKTAPLPVAEPTDGPADLDAKADILADQSRRVRGEADALGGRVAELKGRQELRRRAADLDRDPFGPLEGSKRRVASIASPSAGPHTPTGDSAGGGSPTTLMPPVTSTGPQATVGGSQPPASPIPVTSGTGASLPTLAVELRDLLDPATVADIRRLEGPKAPAGSVPALERAVAALRARADSLDAAARAMRASARAAH